MLLGGTSVKYKIVYSPVPAPLIASFPEQKSDEYVVHVIQPHDDAVPGWTHVVPLSKLNTAEFEDRFVFKMFRSVFIMVHLRYDFCRVQRILALRPTAIETLHVIHSTIDGWFSKNGKVVLVGNCVHASCVCPTDHSTCSHPLTDYLAIVDKWRRACGGGRCGAREPLLTAANAQSG